MLWLDLCSGLGGASQPALDRGWRVIRVDIDPRFRPTIVADLRSLPFKPFDIDVLWAFTPCTEYSKWGLRCFYPHPPAPDISLELGVLRAIERFKPHQWIVENVWAARPWLTQLFGPVTAMIPGHALWSNSVFLLPNTPAHKGNMDRSGRWGLGKSRWWTLRGKSPCWTGHNGVSAEEAARIPYEIGEAICIAIERRRQQCFG